MQLNVTQITQCTQATLGDLGDPAQNNSTMQCYVMQLNSIYFTIFTFYNMSERSHVPRLLCYHTAPTLVCGECCHNSSYYVLSQRPLPLNPHTLNMGRQWCLTRPPLPLILFLDASSKNCVSSSWTKKKKKKKEYIRLCCIQTMFWDYSKLNKSSCFKLPASPLQKLPQMLSFWTQGATGVPRILLHHKLVKLTSNFSFLNYFHFDHQLIIGLSAKSLHPQYMAPPRPTTVHYLLQFSKRLSFNNQVKSSLFVWISSLADKRDTSNPLE